MIADLEPGVLFEKAGRASASARLLLDAGDIDGACNRAYYAMFYAARAALSLADAPVPADIGKTHGGLIAAFSLHLVKKGDVPRELGRALNRAEEIRIAADYKAGSVEAQDVRQMITQAEHFVEEMQARFHPGEGDTA